MQVDGIFFYVNHIRKHSPFPSPPPPPDRDVRAHRSLTSKKVGRESRMMVQVQSPKLLRGPVPLTGPFGVGFRGCTGKASKRKMIITSPRNAPRSWYYDYYTLCMSTETRGGTSLARSLVCSMCVLPRPRERTVWVKFERRHRARY